MKHILTYLPMSLRKGANTPKVFSSENEAREELLKHICEDCLDMELEGCPYKIADVNDINSLLDTRCGCEWDYEIIQ